MLREDEGSDGAVGDEAVSDGSGGERRRAFRRKFPLGRGAVLAVGDRSHIVGLADVSTTGAYLMTRAPVAPGETHVLRILSMPSRVELAVKVEIKLRAKDKGQIVLRFESNDDFMRLLETLQR